MIEDKFKIMSHFCSEKFVTNVLIDVENLIDLVYLIFYTFLLLNTKLQLKNSNT